MQALPHPPLRRGRPSSRGERYAKPASKPRAGGKAPRGDRSTRADREETTQENPAHAQRGRAAARGEEAELAPKARQEGPGARTECSSPSWSPHSRATTASRRSPTSLRGSSWVWSRCHSRLHSRSASELGPQAGLYTAIIAGFLISALGGSRVQIGGPTGAFVVIVYGIVRRSAASAASPSRR